MIFLIFQYSSTNSMIYESTDLVGQGVVGVDWPNVIYVGF
jgi:hypothetical protein